MIRFDYKYDNLMKGNDNFIAEIVLIDENGSEIAKSLFKGNQSNSWNNQVVNIEYDISKQIPKVKQMYIRFVSGEVTGYSRSDYAVAPNFGNMTDGEYTGSHLYIDNVELIYE